MIGEIPTIVKPIFLCNALRPQVGLDPQCESFKLSIPTCWYLKTLADPTESPNLSQQCPTRAPRRASRIWLNTRELGLRWDVHFMLFVSILFVLVTQRKPSFWWNMGLPFIRVF